MSKKKKKIFIFIILFLLAVGACYLAVQVNRLNSFEIGKTIYFDFKNADTEYLEYLLTESGVKSDPNGKLDLLKEDAVDELIRYMRENNLRIVDGSYAVPQTSNFEELIEILNFEEVK